MLGGGILGFTSVVGPGVIKMPRTFVEHNPEPFYILQKPAGLEVGT